MKSIFELLNVKIQNLLFKKKINKPTEPQIKAIPVILEGNNLLLIAPTGLGKTESALLPIFHKFIELKEKNKIVETEKGIKILYITPLRALNRDMLKRTIEWGKELHINIAVRHGDTSQSERARQSRNPPDMIITTPETFQILFTGKKLRKYLSSVRWVIVDEIHEMAGDERGAQLSIALERLHELTNNNNIIFQRIGLSATVGTPEEVARFLGGFEYGKFRDVKIIDVNATKNLDILVEIPDIIKGDYVNSKKLLIEPFSFSALRRCKEIIDSHTSTLLFINTRDGSEILASRFHRWIDDFQIDVHHGSLSKNARIESEDNFKQGKLKSLICTSSLELGIDVGHTDFIIQYNSPREVKRIIQRIGRSGHCIGKTSKGIIISTTTEDFAESIVIARRAINSEIESLNVRQNPLSVLTNQIISIALEYGQINIEKIFKIIKRAYPFYKLSQKIFIKIIEQLKNQRNIWFQNNIINKKSNSRNYFLDNISMIPDEKTFLVEDISSRKIIGKLDESFVLNNGFDGAKFILRGRPWQIIKSDEDKLLVHYSKEIGNIPSWTGEDIPVPFKVAREVGKLRNYNSFEDICRNYPGNKKSFEKFRNEIENQKKQGFIIPDDKTITIEIEGNLVVINACFGTKVNETIGRLVSAYLVQSIGESVGINIDAYRINFEIPVRIPAEKIKEILVGIKPENLFYLLNTILKNSTYIRWQIIQIARKFGALRKDFDYKTVGLKKIFTLFENTLIFDETIDKILWEKMDIKNTKKIFDEIQNKKIKIFIQRLSPISIAGLETIRGLMAPQRADKSILMALKNRLDETNISFVCINCKNIWKTILRRVNDKPKCSRCGAIKIAVFVRGHIENVNLINKKNRSTEETKKVRKLHKNASLVLSYGKPAIYALVGRGIGPDTAARILKKYDSSQLNKSQDIQIKFLRDILKAELNYARTRGFWDNN